MVLLEPSPLGFGRPAEDMVDVAVVPAAAKLGVEVTQVDLRQPREKEGVRGMISEKASKGGWVVLRNGSFQA